MTDTKPPPPRNWRLLYVEAGEEFGVAEEMADLGYEAFVAKSRRWVRPRGTKSRREVIRPAFARYVFFKVGERTDWMAIRDVRGVHSVLCNDNAPVRVLDSTVEHLQVAQDMGLFDDAGHAPAIVLRIGDKVVVEEQSNLLHGYTAVVKRPPGSRTGCALVELGPMTAMVPFDKLRVVA